MLCRYSYFQANHSCWIECVGTLDSVWQAWLTRKSQLSPSFAPCLPLPQCLILVIGFVTVLFPTTPHPLIPLLSEELDNRIHLVGHSLGAHAMGKVYWNHIHLRKSISYVYILYLNQIVSPSFHSMTFCQRRVVSSLPNMEGRWSESQVKSPTRLKKETWPEK